MHTPYILVHILVLFFIYVSYRRYIQKKHKSLEHRTVIFIFIFIFIFFPGDSAPAWPLQYICSTYARDARAAHAVTYLPTHIPTSVVTAQKKRTRKGFDVGGGKAESKQARLCMYVCMYACMYVLYIVHTYVGSYFGICRARSPSSYIRFP